MDQKNMEYCMFCGTKLKDRELEGEGMIPFCEKCGDYRFPVFNTAVSMIVTNTSQLWLRTLNQSRTKKLIIIGDLIWKVPVRIYTAALLPRSSSWDILTGNIISNSQNTVTRSVKK